MLNIFRGICLTVLLAIFVIGSGASAQSSQPDSESKTSMAKEFGTGKYAILQTNMGVIISKLLDNVAPKTVESFIGLAEGTREFTDPTTGQKAKRPYFDGTVFHRVIPNFMIQGGDPTGTGRGGPGYVIPDEIKASLKFDRPGRLAMANSGPNTGGSQFFITHGPTQHLNGLHTIFGQVVKGREVVNSIGRVQTLKNRGNRPVVDIVLEKVIIERVE